MVHKIPLQHSTAEAFVCTTNIHMLTMPPKRKTLEEVSSMITTLTQENLAKIQNTKLDIRLKIQDEQIKLEAFEKCWKKQWVEWNIFVILVVLFNVFNFSSLVEQISFLKKLQSYPHWILPILFWT